MCVLAGFTSPSPAKMVRGIKKGQYLEREVGLDFASSSIAASVRSAQEGKAEVCESLAGPSAVARLLMALG